MKLVDVEPWINLLKQEIKRLERDGGSDFVIETDRQATRIYTKINKEVDEYVVNILESMPVAVLNVPDTNVGDTVSRQNIIQHIEEKIARTENRGLYKEGYRITTIPHEKSLFKSDIDVRDIHEVRYMQLDGKLLAYDELLEFVKALPSSQPEIIRCKDCRYATMTSGGQVKYCDQWLPLELYEKGDFYCGYAERKDNG